MIEVYFDGGCFPNPNGVCTWGYLIKKDGKEICHSQGIYGEGIGMTNNVAEYRGLIEAMKCLLKNGFEDKKITFCGDSSLVINQMIGNFRVPKNNKPYAAHAREALQWKTKFTATVFKWIPREDNTEADALTELAARSHAPNSAPVG